jgi:hypothetical protein
MAGERFWIVVYPRQITSLRHVWEHPAFPLSGETEKSSASVHPADPADISRQWIRDFAESVGLGSSTLMVGATDWVNDKKCGGDGEYLCFGGLLEGQNVPDEFWTHYERVTGDTVIEDHRCSFFTCSC